MLDYLYSALANPTVDPNLNWHSSSVFQSTKTKNNKQSNKSKVKETTLNRRSYGSIIGQNVRQHVTARKYATLVNELDAIAEESDEDEDDSDPMVVEYVADKLQAKIFSKTSPSWRKLENDNSFFEDEPLMMGRSSKRFLSSKSIKSAGKRIRKALRKSISYLAMGLANMTTFVLVPTNIPSPMYHCREFNPYY